MRLQPASRASLLRERPGCEAYSVKGCAFCIPFCNVIRDKRQIISVTPHNTTGETAGSIIPAMRERGKHFIREWRTYRKLSLRKLADRMESEPGVQLTSHSNIDRIEKGEQPYTQDIIEAIADALEVSVTELLTVDPSKDGEVVDLLHLINKREKDRDAAIRMLRGLAEGTNG